MKKLFFTLMLGMAIGSFAQTPKQPVDPNNNASVEALRIAYISKQLELTPEEAQKFWPVFNQYTGELKQLRQQFNASQQKDELAWEETVLNLRKKYKPEFLKAIPQQKFDKMLRLDKEFREKVKNEWKRRQEIKKRPMQRFPH